MSAYDEFRAECEKNAMAFDRAAERARSKGDLGRAYACTNQAVRLRYLAEYDGEVAELFNLCAERERESLR